MYKRQIVANSASRRVDGDAGSVVVVCVGGDGQGGCGGVQGECAGGGEVGYGGVAVLVDGEVA